MRKLIHSQVTVSSPQLHCKTMVKARQQMIVSLCNNIYKQWQYQRDKKKLACLVLFPPAESSLKIRKIVFWHAPSRDNIIGFILHQLKISPLKCALPHGIESSKNFQTLPHNHIRPPTLNISDPDVILFVIPYICHFFYTGKIFGE